MTNLVTTMTSPWIIMVTTTTCSPSQPPSRVTKEGWLTDNLNYRVVKNLPKSKDPRVLKDQLIVLKTPSSRKDYPGALALVTARVEVDRQVRVMEVLTNNMQWSAGNVADLYRCRWQIEVFFRQIKQTLQLADFFGHNTNAVKWQLWMALLVYVLLRFHAWRTNWAHSFSRLLTLLRAALRRCAPRPSCSNATGQSGETSTTCTRPARRRSAAIESHSMGQHA